MLTTMTNEGIKSNKYTVKVRVKKNGALLRQLES